MVSLDWTLATLYNLSGKDGREDFDLGRFSMRENSEAPSAYPLFILKNFRRPRAFFWNPQIVVEESGHEEIDWFDVIEEEYSHYFGEREDDEPDVFDAENNSYRVRNFNFWNLARGVIIFNEDFITILDRIFLYSLAPHWLCFPCEEGDLKVNIILFRILMNDYYESLFMTHIWILICFEFWSNVELKSKHLFEGPRA